MDNIINTFTSFVYTIKIMDMIDRINSIIIWEYDGVCYDGGECNTYH